MRRAMKLRTQIVLLQSAIMLVVILGSGVAAAWLQERSLRDAYLDRMIGVAYSVAQLPSVTEAFDDPDPAAVIQPIAETVREASDVTYVVVSNVEGIRYSHPNPERIGEVVSTPPDAARSGELVTTTETGTLGTSWRAKVPVFGPDGEIIGQVSVGILESELHAEWLSTVWILGLCLAVAAIVGVLLAGWAAAQVRKRIYGVEPDEIKSMLETRNATLHGIGEGLVVLDDSATITLCNDSALRLLGREGDDLAGVAIAEVLDAQLELLLADAGEQQLVLAGERMLVARADPVVVDGRTVGTVLILRDRTELDAALRDLAGAQGMTETLRAQQHEFANTLHTLGGLLELGEAEAAMQVIERAGAGGALAALEPASGILELEVAALLLAKRAQAREHGVELVVRDGSRLRPAAPAGDASDWVTVLGNLLDNAIEAAAGGRVEVAIDDVDAEAGRVVTIVVDDDGPGVPEGRRAAIFDLEESTKPRAAGLARGYGLTLVRRVVERLGGSAAVEASPLGGARFTATLPVARREVPA
ncbi:sensor histidine kinase [Agrococcus sp. TF02-05]|uniref:ATP-binding protein n=1 Tax=Agrococcus sp. TF02-05 TaxID=2815211 RepID=UPI001AA1938D|nr:sensor histidine kinase [Agrococcus sp. TF02-05]MBO1769652.1 sensor histidine kinase [Agrococcus sp. TF02-05]